MYFLFFSVEASYVIQLLKKSFFPVLSLWNVQINSELNGRLWHYFEVVDIPSYKTHCFWTRGQDGWYGLWKYLISIWSEEIYDLTLSQSPLLIGKQASFLTTNVFFSVWSPAIDMMSQSTLITSLLPTPCINISLYQDQEKDLFMVFQYMKVKRKQLSV